MSRAEDLLFAALKRLPEKPPDGAGQQTLKKRYSELMSQVLAAALAEELRQRGLASARPGGDGEIGLNGAERRMSGGIGAKKVDVTWATEESGLILAISIKCITSKDPKTGNYQKNLINRRSDILGEAVTLHRRFPYAVLGGFIFFDKGASTDGSPQRSSTFTNAHRAFRIFSARSDPQGRDEQYERLYLSLVEANPFKPEATFTHAGEPTKTLTLDQALDRLLISVAERDPDMYALLGPAGEVDPAPDASPLCLARMRSSGSIVKGKAPKRSSTRPSTSQLSLDAAEPSDEYDGVDDDDEAPSL